MFRRVVGPRGGVPGRLAVRILVRERRERSESHVVSRSRAVWMTRARGACSPLLYSSKNVGGPGEVFAYGGVESTDEGGEAGGDGRRDGGRGVCKAFLPRASSWAGFRGSWRLVPYPENVAGVEKGAAA